MPVHAAGNVLEGININVSNSSGGSGGNPGSSNSWDRFNLKKVSVNFIQELLPATVKWLNKVDFVDRSYWLGTASQYLQIAEEARSLDHNYVIDRFDCDDFSAVLYCYARYKYGCNGIARVFDWLARHSYNLCMDKEGNTYVIEPQTCQIWPVWDRPRKLYKLLFGLIIW